MLEVRGSGDLTLDPCHKTQTQGSNSTTNNTTSTADNTTSTANNTTSTANNTTSTADNTTSTADNTTSTADNTTSTENTNSGGQSGASWSGKGFEGVFAGINALAQAVEAIHDRVKCLSDTGFEGKYTVEDQNGEDQEFDFEGCTFDGIKSWATATTEAIEVLSRKTAILADSDRFLYTPSEGRPKIVLLYRVRDGNKWKAGSYQSTIWHPTASAVNKLVIDVSPPWPRWLGPHFVFLTLTDGSGMPAYGRDLSEAIAQLGNLLQFVRPEYIPAQWQNAINPVVKPKVKVVQLWPVKVEYWPDGYSKGRKAEAERFYPKPWAK
jgi:hypothetical protein